MVLVWSSLLSHFSVHFSLIFHHLNLNLPASYPWNDMEAVPGLPTGHSPQPLLTSNAPLPLQRLIMGAAASLVDVYHVQNHPYYEVEKGGKPISSTTAARKKEKKSVGIGTCKISTRVHLRNHKTKPISNNFSSGDFRSLKPRHKERKQRLSLNKFSGCLRWNYYVQFLN